MYKIFKRLLLVAIVSMFALETHAQQTPTVIVQGVVKDAETNESLIGVYVRTKRDPKIGIATNEEGKFRLKVNQNDILVISYVGYTTLEIAVNNYKNTPIKLKSSGSLSEVVVIGYGAVNRKDLTGAVGEVKMDDLNKAPVSSFDQALAGRISGVSVSSADGQPGEEMSIVIRGGNSLTQSNAPLYVIDGFPIEDFTNAALNQKDIKSITILKDASATAIYGARGANGVVVIETKNGQLGKPVVTYNGSYGMNQVTQRMKVFSPVDFVKYQLAINNTLATSIYLKDGKTLESYNDVTGVDWQNQIFQKGSTLDQYVSVSGGTPQTKYSISASVFNQDGVIINSGFNRYQGRMSLDQVINPKWKVGLRMNYSAQTSNGQIVSSSVTNTFSTSLMYAVWGYRPVTGRETSAIEDELFDEDDATAGDLKINPVLSTKNEYKKKLINNFIVNAYTTYDFSKDLQLKITGATNGRLINDKSFNNSNTLRGNIKNPNNTRRVNGDITYSDRFDWTNENTLTYNKTFNRNHKLNVVGGFTMQGVNVSTYGYSAQGIPDETLGIAGLSTGTVYSLNALESNSSLMSFLTRATYTYHQKYTITGTIRADGSSKFAPQNRWGYFPSAAFAWRMGEEKFLKNLKFVSDAKLRVSYGLTGNNRVGDFDYLATIAYPDAGVYSFDNYPSLGAIPATLSNTDLRWESTGQVDIGYDLSLFKNRFNFSVDWYRKTTKDLLLDANLPYSTGYSTVTSNVGKIQNQGLELTLGTVNIKTRNFNWSSDFNISFNQNKILALSSGQDNLRRAVSWNAVYNSTSLYLAKVGSPAAQLYGYLFDGIYQYDDFIRNADNSYTLKPSQVSIPAAHGVIQPGDPKYKDVNHDGTIDLNDMTVMGRSLPLHTGGFNNNFSYKGITLSVLLQWCYGNDIYNANRIILESNEYNRVGLNLFDSAKEYWSSVNPSNTMARIKANRLAGAYTSQYVEDGSYLRLKTVSLNYNFPTKLVSRLRMNSLGVFASAQNLYTWTNYSGMDPEVSSKNSILTPGFDYSAYPRGRVITFGIQASL